MAHLFGKKPKERMRLIDQLFLQIMKRKSNLLKGKHFMIMISILVTCCQTYEESFAGAVSENEIKKLCQRDAIFATDIFREFGETVGGGDTLNGFFYHGENNMTYIFEYQEPNMEPFGEEKIDYSSINILNIYRQKSDGSLELLWKNTTIK